MDNGSKTLKELWKKSVKVHKEHIQERDYIPILVASIVSSATSWALTKSIFNASSTLSLLVKVLLAAIGFSFVFFMIILLYLKLIVWLKRLTCFSGLVWNKWRPFSKPKN